MSDFKIPKKLGEVADLLYTTRQERLELQRQVDELEERESDLKAHIIETLPKSEASGVAGRLASVSVVEKEIPTAEDWDQVYAYIKKKGAFDLLQRRLNNAAIDERWEAGEQVPGVGVFKSKTVSIKKV